MEELGWHNESESFPEVLPPKVPTPPLWIQLRRLLPRETVRALVGCPDNSVWCRIENWDWSEDRVRYVDSLWNMIQHLNDDHEWTRERIADWLDSLDLDLEFKILEDE